MTVHGEAQVDEILEGLQRHMAADGDVGMVTGYVIAAKWVTEEGEHRMWIEHMASMPMSDGLGLLAAADLFHRQAMLDGTD